MWPDGQGGAPPASGDRGAVGGGRGDRHSGGRRVRRGRQGDELPDELKSGEDRPAEIREAKARLETGLYGILEESLIEGLLAGVVRDPVLVHPAAA